MAKKWLISVSLLCLLTAACAPATGPIILGTDRLVRPVDVADVDMYSNERCIGLLLADSEGTEVLVSVIRTLKPTLRGMEAYRPLDLPCGTVLVGTLLAAVPPGREIDRGGATAQSLRRILTDFVKRESCAEELGWRDGERPKHVKLVREVIEILDDGCEPSN